VLFDVGAFTIANDLTFVGIGGSLTVVKGHLVGPAHLAYHRDRVWPARHPRLTRGGKRSETPRLWIQPSQGSNIWPYARP
jgi:hypothetical protein